MWLGGWGRVGSNSDYMAISGQLQLELIAGTELGNIGRGAKGDYQKYYIGRVGWPPTLVFHKDNQLVLLVRGEI